MKKDKIYFLCIFLFLGIMFWVEYNQPKKFIWTPTFNRYSSQPFGCKIFDDVISTSYPDGYTVSRETFYQLAKDSLARYAVLVVEEELWLNKTDVEAIMTMAARGSKLLLVSSAFRNYTFGDTLSFRFSRNSPFSEKRFKEYIVSSQNRETFRWSGDSTYNEKEFTYYPNLLSTFFMLRDSLSKVLAVKVEDEKDSQLERKDSLVQPEKVLAFSRRVGEGEIILVSTPLLFTNYGMLDGDNATYIFRLLNRLKGLPLIRTEGYSPSFSEEQRSPFRYFLSHRPLRWALYLAMITCVLFMIFTARRRQRAIPVIQDPENKSLEFTKLIGTLYFQKKNHADLVCKNFICFAETLRRDIQVNAEDDSDDETLCRKIALKTGMEEEMIRRLFVRLRSVLRGEATVTEKEMQELIQQTNEIIDHL